MDRSDQLIIDPIRGNRIGLINPFHILDWQSLGLTGSDRSGSIQRSKFANTASARRPLFIIWLPNPGINPTPRKYRVVDFALNNPNLPNTNRTRVLFGSSSIRTEPNKGVNVRNPGEHEPNKGTVRFCSMWRRTRTNRTRPRKCSVRFVCSVNHLCP